MTMDANPSPALPTGPVHGRRSERELAALRAGRSISHTVSWVRSFTK